LLCHVMSKNWVPQNTFLSSISHPFFPILGLTSPFWDVTTPKDSIVSHVIKLSALHPIVSTSYIYIHILCLCVCHYISITVCSMLSQLNPTISQWHPIISRLYISHKKKLVPSPSYPIKISNISNHVCWSHQNPSVWLGFCRRHQDACWMPSFSLQRPRTKFSRHCDRSGPRCGGVCGVRGAE
jgi:hypothetical protein